MTEEARLEEVGSGLAPTSPGWLTVNVADAAWIVNDSFSARCIFESNPRVLQERPDLEPQHFDQLGVTLAVLPPGKSGGLYHSESAQDAYAPHPHWRPGRPETWNDLPWVRSPE